MLPTGDPYLTPPVSVSARVARSFFPSVQYCMIVKIGVGMKRVVATIGAAMPGEPFTISAHRLNPEKQVFRAAKPKAEVRTAEPACYDPAMKAATIEDYHAAQSPGDRAICDALRRGINQGLPDAESRIWHAHPVWFLDGNPIVGYSKLKTCIRLLFWSGQSFETSGLKPEGSFKAAEARYTDAGRIDVALLARWLDESRRIQWDYKNIYKRKGRLERLV